MNLEKIIHEKGYSQSRLAKECQVTKGHINQIVHGKARPSVKLLYKLSYILNIEAKFLLDRYK